MSAYQIVLIAAAVIIITVAIAVIIKLIPNESSEEPGRAAGKAGEKYASEIIRSVLRDGDLHFTNVSVSYNGKTAELDNVIVNKNGVFIIEVKNYSGALAGSETDFEWSKYHVSKGGNTYVKTVKNPIKQVNRQVYILSKFLYCYGVNVWVDGYVMILGARSPVDSKSVLQNTGDINRVIHTPGKKTLNKETVNSIHKLLI